MRFSLPFMVFSAFALAPAAQASELPEAFAGYRLAGNAVLTELASAAPDASRVSAELERLIAHAKPILIAYGDRYPACQAQLDVIVADADAMLGMSLDELRHRYHAGEGLPEGPAQCYFPRDLVVHPAMGAVVAADGLAGRDAAFIQREVREVMHHVNRVEQELAN